ncbi:MAG: hypothetical protein U0795_08720 [Pirellulales bacterium]
MCRMITGSWLQCCFLAGCCWLVSLAGTAVAQPASADSAGLAVGQPAPPLQISEWIKGPAVTKFEPGRIYVISFWASWSPPSLPPTVKLSRLQRDHPDRLVVIGVTSERRSSLHRFLRRTAPTFDLNSPNRVASPNDNGDRIESGVGDRELTAESNVGAVTGGSTEVPADEEESAMRKWGDVIGYTVAVDDAGQRTSDAYLKAARIDHLPTIFVVGPEGLIEWFGHPNEMSEPIDQMLAGNWDRAEYWRQHSDLSQVSIALGDIEDALVRGDRSGAVAACQKHHDFHPENSMIDQLLTALRDQWVPGSSVIEQWNRQAAASWNDPTALNKLAWFVLTEVNPELRDGALALRIAERANELTGQADAAMIDTLARAHYVMGNLMEAVRIQTIAVSQSRGDGINTMLTQTLEKYQSELNAQYPPAVEPPISNTIVPEATTLNEPPPSQPDPSLPVPAVPATPPVAPAPPLPESN